MEKRKEQKTKSETPSIKKHPFKKTNASKMDKILKEIANLKNMMKTFDSEEGWKPARAVDVISKIMKEIETKIENTHEEIREKMESITSLVNTNNESNRDFRAIAAEAINAQTYNMKIFKEVSERRTECANLAEATQLRSLNSISVEIEHLQKSVNNWTEEVKMLLNNMQESVWQSGANVDEGQKDTNDENKKLCDNLEMKINNFKNEHHEVIAQISNSINLLRSA